MSKISVVVPVYNVEKYIVPCLDSIIGQTYKDLEIICVNDGSTDNSLKILQEYAQKDNRIVIISQENQGLWSARNTGMKVVTGKYLIFVDSDDWLEPNACEILHNEFENTTADVIQFDYILTKESGQKYKKDTLSKRVRQSFNFKLKDKAFFNRHNLSKFAPNCLSYVVWNKIYRMEFIRKNNIKFGNIRIGEDGIFTIRVFMLAGNILYLNKYLYFYRLRKGSITNKVSKQGFEVFKYVEIVKQFLIDYNFYEQLENDFKKYAMEEIYFHYLKMQDSSKEKYLDTCKQVLSKDELNFLKEKIKKEVDLSFFEKIFSIKNYYENIYKYKILTILGVKIKLRGKNKSK